MRCVISGQWKKIIKLKEEERNTHFLVHSHISVVATNATSKLYCSMKNYTTNRNVTHFLRVSLSCAPARSKRPWPKGHGIEGIFIEMNFFLSWSSLVLAMLLSLECKPVLYSNSITLNFINGIFVLTHHIFHLNRITGSRNGSGCVKRNVFCCRSHRNNSQNKFPMLLNWSIFYRC